MFIYYNPQWRLELYRVDQRAYREGLNYSMVLCRILKNLVNVPHRKWELLAHKAELWRIRQSFNLRQCSSRRGKSVCATLTSSHAKDTASESRGSWEATAALNRNTSNDRVGPSADCNRTRSVEMSFLGRAPADPKKPSRKRFDRFRYAWRCIRALPDLERFCLLLMFEV